jgi:hypothetical protein
MQESSSQSNQSDSAGRDGIPRPGHNSDVEAKLQGFVASYRRFRKEEGQNYVRRCKVVIEAETELTLEAFDDFLRQVNLPRESSNFRKARAIAKAADRLLEISDLLPDSKSALYELSIVDTDRVSQLIADGAITPSVTAEQIRVKTRESKEVKCVVPIDVTSLDPDKRLEVLKQVQLLASRFHAKVRVPNILKDAGAAVTKSRDVELVGKLVSNEGIALDGPTYPARSRQEQIDSTVEAQDHQKS